MKWFLLCFSLLLFFGAAFAGPVLDDTAHVTFEVA